MSSLFDIVEDFYTSNATEDWTEDGEQEVTVFGSPEFRTFVSRVKLTRDPEFILSKIKDILKNSNITEDETKQIVTLKGRIQNFIQNSK